MSFSSFISLSAIGALALSCPWDLRTGDENFAGAQPIAREKWVTSSDYVHSASGHYPSGRVVVHFTITKEGRVQDCEIKMGSGESLIDGVSCRLLVRRARFVPARDSQGQPKSTAGFMSFYFSPE